MMDHSFMQKIQPEPVWERDHGQGGPDPDQKNLGLIVMSQLWPLAHDSSAARPGPKSFPNQSTARQPWPILCQYEFLLPTIHLFLHSRWPSDLLFYAEYMIFYSLFWILPNWSGSNPFQSRSLCIKTNVMLQLSFTSPYHKPLGMQSYLHSMLKLVKKLSLAWPNQLPLIAALEKV